MTEGTGGSSGTQPATGSRRDKSLRFGLIAKLCNDRRLSGYVPVTFWRFDRRPARTVSSTRKPQTVSEDPKNCLVLLVEDDAVVAIDLEDSLREAGYAVAGSFSTCAAATKWLERCREIGTTSEKTG